MADDDSPVSSQGLSEDAAAAGEPLDDWIAQAIRNASGGQGSEDLSVEAGQAAEQAAAASGLSVGDWIGQAVRTATVEQAAADALSPDAAEAARSAAGAAGIPLGNWITKAIRQATETPPPEAPPAEPAAPTPEPPKPAPARAARPAPTAKPAPAAAKPAVPARPPSPTARESADDTDMRQFSRPIALKTIQPGRFRTRDRIDPEEIDALSRSIGERGVLQPILVRRHPDLAETYEIIAGERRWRAAQQANLSEIPAVVLDLNDREAMEIALVENLQRRDLSPLEEAEGYRRLMDEFAHTQDDMAQAVGRSRSHIANLVRLIRLPDPVKALLRDGLLTAGHARALLNAPDAGALAHQVVERGLNVRQTESLVQAALSGEPKRERQQKDEDIIAIERELSAILGMRVRIRVQQDRGTLSVRFRGLSALGDLVSRLHRSNKG